MVNRIEIIPLEVRGYGNIVTPKTSNDFIGKYNEIYTNADGDFILSYGGVMLKITSNLSNTIKGLTAGLNVIVTTREGGVPVSGLTVDCSIDEVSLTSETTDSNGECSFNWSPQIVGDSTILITIQQQDGYAGLTETKEITIGLLLSFNNIMNDLRLEDDELYVADISQQIESRTQLNPFVKDVWVAEGGEPIVDEYGIVHIAEKGDLIVEQDSLDQSLEYDNVIFEGDVELLTGAVYDMSLTEDYELIVNCLEREDINPITVSLTSDKSILSYADSESATLSATVLDNSSNPIEDVIVEFFNGSTSMGTATTNSSGIATKTYASTGAGDVSFTARVGTVVSETYEVLDCLYYDDMSSDTSADYFINSNYSTIAYQNNAILLTIGSGDKYTQLGGNTGVSDVSPYLDKTVRFECHVKPSNTCRLQIYQYINGAYSNVSSEYVSSETDIALDSAISSSATRILFRIDATRGNIGDTVEFKNFKVYEVTPVPFDGVTLTADKSILSYADSDTCTLTAQLKNNGSSASAGGVTVEFFKGSTSLGTATTNSSGVATKTYSSTGSGVVSLTAAAGTFVSETYSLWDCVLVADALSDFEIQSGTLTLEDGVFTKSTDGNINLLNPDNPVRYGWSGAKTIEFDVVSRNTLAVQFYKDNTHRFAQRISNLGGTDGCHVKIVYDGTTITPYIDGVEKTSYIITTTLTDGYLIGFMNQGSFQNVIVY